MRSPRKLKSTQKAAVWRCTHNLAIASKSHRDTLQNCGGLVVIDRLLCRADQRVGQAVGQTYSKKDGLSDKIFCPARSYMRFSKVTVVRKRGFPNECREKSVILSWAGIRSGFGRFSR